MTQVFTHRFTNSGLGEAPFQLLGVQENALQMPDGTTNPGGTCDHCWTGIRWECVILSSDGIKSVVGTDCIRHLHDAKLSTKVKRETNKRRREQARIRREAKREAELEAQRQRNGGRTNNEVRRDQREAQEAARRDAEIERRKPVIEVLAPLADLIQDGKGGFCDSIAISMRHGDVPVGRGGFLVCEIIAKRQGRRNSKAFDAEFERIETILEGLI